MYCCTPGFNLGKEFDCKVEEIDAGICVSFTTDDKKKAAALKSMMKSYCELRGDECCSGDDKSSCC